MAHNIIMAQNIHRERGLCSRCEYFSAREFDNGDRRFVCTAESEQHPIPLHRVVTQCTSYEPKDQGQVYGSMGWVILVDAETGAISFRDPQYATYKIERVKGKAKVIRLVQKKGGGA